MLKYKKKIFLTLCLVFTMLMMFLVPVVAISEKDREILEYERDRAILSSVSASSTLYVYMENPYVGDLECFRIKLTIGGSISYGGGFPWFTSYNYYYTYYDTPWYNIIWVGDWSFALWGRSVDLTYVGGKIVTIKYTIIGRANREIPWAYIGLSFWLELNSDGSSTTGINYFNPYTTYLHGVLI